MSQIPPIQPFGARMFGHKFQEPKQPVDPQDVANQMDGATEQDAQQAALSELGLLPEDEQRLIQLGVAYDINVDKPGHDEFWFVPMDVLGAITQWYEQGQPEDLVAFLGY